MIDAGGYNVGVGVVQRPGSATQGSIEHDKLTEVYYVLEGTGTLVTGGTQTNAKPVSPESATFRELTGPSSTGTGVAGGQSRRIGPGDVVIIPPGVPHWFSGVEGTIRYLVVRVDPERLLTLK
jgi:mannose-6-phosphate isomerase-like protein (cupin superfamily)